MAIILQLNTYGFSDPIIQLGKQSTLGKILKF